MFNISVRHLTHVARYAQSMLLYGTTVVKT